MRAGDERLVEVSGIIDDREHVSQSVPSTVSQHVRGW